MKLLGQGGRKRIRSGFGWLHMGMLSLSSHCSCYHNQADLPEEKESNQLKEETGTLPELCQGSYGNSTPQNFP